MSIRALLLVLLPFVLQCTDASAVSFQNSSTAATIEIEQVLNNFSHAVDTHDYAMLDSVFTTDAVADFATSVGYIHGLPSIKKGLEQALGKTVSQHTLSTHGISILENDITRASARTYLQGTIFGQGNLTGQRLTTYGSYRDLLRRTEQGWRVCNKTLIVIVSLIYCTVALILTASQGQEGNAGVVP